MSDRNARSRGWGVGTAGLLAWRNLAHDRSRFVVTLLGITFAVALVAIQIGLFLGFSDTTTTVITHTRADLWVAAKGTQNFEIASPIPDRHLYRLRGLPGVAYAEPLIVQFLPWTKPDGGDEGVIVIGFDLDSGLAGPWGLVRGSIDDLRLADTVIVDDIYLDKLGISGVGDSVEINGNRARVVGLTHGIRSFTTSPWVFTSYRTARKMTGFGDDKSNYAIAVRAPGVDVDALRAEAQAALRDTSVFTGADFAAQTRDYWIHSTGAGAALFTAALLGLVVGAVVVAQVLYATTIDHLAEFGTLRAMGAPRRYIYKIIVGQAVISAVLGHALGIGAAKVAAWLSEDGAALILVPDYVSAGLFPVTLGMCVLASFVSIRRAMTIDPALVFQR